ncbi:hypothetical protein TNCV_61541 [Trichonephila clavipes]|nr:hypothetical protein TNCV_61541 [Trichonephila clavipes]
MISRTFLLEHLRTLPRMTSVVLIFLSNRFYSSTNVYTCKKDPFEENGLKLYAEKILLSQSIQRQICVCELQLAGDGIQRNTEAYDDKTEEKICVPVKNFRLQNFAVPIFPRYLSSSTNPIQECPEQRQQKPEHLQGSIQENIIFKEEFEKNKAFKSFPELVECLSTEKLQDIWTVVYKKDQVVIMMLDTTTSLVIKSTVIINEELDLSLYIDQTKIDLNFL